MAGYFDGSEYHYCQSITETVDLILNNPTKEKTKIVYAHNGGKYDFQFFIDELKARNYAMDITEIHGRIAQLRIQLDKKRKVLLRDSICILNSSLEKLCKAFNTKTKKLTGTINFEAGERVDKDNALHRQYLENDCISLYEVIESYFNMPLVKDCNKKLTTASQAMEVFRRNFLKRPVVVTNQEIQDFCRRGYYGGRVEIFRQDAFNYKIYDCNSMYPYAMLQKIPLEHIGSSNDIDRIGYYDVEIESPGLDIPVLPLRRVIGMSEKLIFPNGRFRGVYFSEELKVAQIYGYKILKLHRGEKFTESSDFFADYINHWYRVRLENPGTALDFTAKLFLNSLYGKFAQRESRRFVTFWNGQEAYESYDDDLFEKYGLVVVESFRREMYMLSHIGAAITAWGRILLNQQLQHSNPYYCDTDSVHTKTELKCGKNLGEWKDETEKLGGKIIRGHYKLPKMYYLEAANNTKYIRGKGFPANYLKSLDFNFFKNNTLHYQKLSFLGFKSSLKSNKSFLGTRNVTRSVISQYDKRVLLESGGTRAWEITSTGEIK